MPSIFDFVRMQSQSYSSIYLALFLLLSAIAYVALSRRQTADSREPPYIWPTLPLVGHVLGMMSSGAKYFETVNKPQRYPVFTLPMLMTRNYIVSDAALAGYVQRNAKTLSFYSLIVEVTRRIIAFDKKAAEISFYNMNGEHGPGGLMQAVHHMMNVHLAPGPALDSITAIQMEYMGDMMDAAVPSRNAGIVTNLYAWQRHIFSLSNAHAIYGPENIFAMHSELESAFWEFEDGMLGLVVDIFPFITARKAHLARKRVLAGLTEYVKSGRYLKACPLIQERVQTNLSFGMSKEMAGHAELILIFGILGNAVPSSFWLIVQIFSRPALLARIREEVEEALDLEPPNEYSVIAIHAKKISMKSCPLLYSCYRETLRDISLLTSARMVLENTLLPKLNGRGEYLLRKNCIVQIAGGVIHKDTKIWGEDVDFNPERFLRASEGDMSSEKPIAAPLPAGVPSPAFRAYGGGTVICPGRHFAQSELMLFAAVLSLGFDVFEANGDTLRLPQKDDTRIPLSVMKPTYDPIVRIQRRNGWEQVKWEVTL